MGSEWGKPKPRRRSPMDTGNGGSGKSGGGGGTTKVLIFVCSIPVTAILLVAGYFVEAAIS